MRDIDFSKPLSEEDEAYLRERLPNERVDHIKAQAGGGDTSDDSRALLNELVAPDGALAASEAARADAGSDPGGARVMTAGDDPNDFTVDQVNAYLKTASDEEKERVLQAERDGQARKTIVGDDSTS